MKKSKKLVSLAITAAMIVSSFPVSAFASEKDDSVFITMNIPYNTFYQADVKNDVSVDAVTSATTSKWKNFGGTYFTEPNENGGGDILGVSFPVEVSKEDYAKLKNAENSSDNYYFTELEETPSVYKTLTLDEDGNFNFSSFVNGTVKTVDDAEVSLSTESKYGDYQFEFKDQNIIDGSTVYSIVLTTEDGTQYGLRHLENIWKKPYQFAWSSGIVTTESHGNTLAPNHYKSIMGKTIKTVTYVTENGVTNYNVSVYVPVKTTSALSVENAKVTDASTKAAVTPELPEDFEAEYAVSGLEIAYANGELSYKNAKPGTYTLTVSDKNGKYADISAAFVLSTDKAAAKYDDNSKSLSANTDVSEDEFKNYLSSIATVTVDGTDYAASGKRAVKIIGDDGKFDLTVKNGSSRVFAADKTEFTVKVAATGYPDSEFTVTKESEVSFVTMNIPYNVFYSSDVKNDVEVDAVTSATTNLWKSFNGSYVTEANENGGGQILGVSFPVEVANEDLDKLKTVEGENSDYYFTALEETPSVYKVLSIDNKGGYSFSDIKGSTETIDGEEYTLSTDTVWGDYLFEFKNTNLIDSSKTVYGIIITTEDGTQYGLRHLENIWKKTYEFSWGSGIKQTEAHGNTFAAKHYKSIMGKTIKTVTYVTDKGITNYTVDAYVPVKAASVVTAADAKATDTSTKVTVKPELPEDYNAEYVVSGLDADYADGTLSFKNAKAGSYTLTVSDKDGKYADLSTTFVLSTDKVVAKYDNDSISLVADNASDEDFKAYLASLTTVKVDDTSYSAAGHGAITIIDPKTGKIDLEAKSRNNPVFDTENKSSFNITVTAAGYPELTFTISTKEEPKKTGLVGDVTGDGKIDSGDSLYILRASVGLEKFSDEQTKLADVNNDGNVLSDDALAVLRYSVKLTDDSNKNVGTEINVD